MEVEGNDNLNQARRIAVQQLKSLALAGLSGLPKPTGRVSFEFTDSAGLDDSTPSTDSNSNQSVTPAKQPAASNLNVKEATISNQLGPSTELDSYEAESLDAGQRTEQLQVLQKRVAECTLCADLASCRKNTVFGVGSPSPELCFLGEGPGADEDRLGEPFVGQAGQLLNKIIGACKMSREEVYILNTVKCRPPGNRNPNESELENCWPYAIEQLEILQPKFICCLGSVAARTLLKTKQSIGRMRGQFFKFRGSQVIVTCLLYTSPSPRDQRGSRMPSSA